MTIKLPKGFSQPVRIGSGGYGSVYRVRQKNINKFVALKYINEKNARSRRELKKEAQMQANLRIAGIPHVYDIQEISGRLCLIMEWIQGCNLRLLMRNSMKDEHKIGIAFEMITIISSLHQAGYAHRDLKPENILISSTGVHLVDFGLSRHISNDKHLTKTGTVKGTPKYMAPELLQFEASEINPVRTDLFSLGKIIIEMFGWDTVPDCISQCVNEDPLLRPESASELLSMWNKNYTQKGIVWDDVKEPFCSELFSKNLYDAANLLVRKRKFDDGYQLLVECLTVNPEFSEAIEMLERFPSIKRDQKLQKTYLLVSAAILFSGIIVLALYFIQKSTKQSMTSTTIISKNNSSGLFMTSVHNEGATHNASLPFKEDSIPVKNIYGQIEICSHPQSGLLRIDNQNVKPDSCSIIIQPAGTRQVLTWSMENGDIVWKETISALPFEEKRIYIKARK